MIAAALRWLALTLGLLAGDLAAVQALVPVPALTARVTDQTGTLTAAQVAALEQRLAAFEARKGSQLAVLIVPTTAPESIEQFALRVAEQWKLGRRRVDDAALLVVAKNERALRIEVGYGLEGALNDATARRIIDEVIVPRLRQQDYAGGLDAGVDRMMRVIDGEPLPAPRAPGTFEDDPLASFPALIAAALVLGMVLRALLGRLAGSVATGVVIGAAVWWMQAVLATALVAGAVALVVSLLASLGLIPMGLGRGGGRRNGSGGFRGGGGGFGGGGASGRW